jgi:hypothetical protein
MYIRKFKFNDLYNFLENASSSEGYKHTDEAKQKMVKRLEDKSNHPFSLPASLRLFFFRRNFNEITRKKIRVRKTS